MIKQIKIVENNRYVYLIDDGQTLILRCKDGDFNINKKDLMDLLNKKNQTFQEIIKDRYNG